MTIAVFTMPPPRRAARAPVARSTSQTSMRILSLRSRSLSFVARRSTIRLPNVLPSRIIAPVVIMLSTSFVAVPAFMRVEPVTTSAR